jgi:hypothetical protein
MPNTKIKSQCAQAAQTFEHSLKLRSDVPDISRRALLETKRQIFRKLSIRIGKRDCFC